MKRNSTIIFALILSGCATVAERRERPATIEYTSTATLEAVKDCMYEKTTEVRVLGFPAQVPMVTKIEGGYEMIFQGDNRVFTDIMPVEGGGTRVKYHRPPFVTIASGTFDKVVNACRGNPPGN